MVENNNYDIENGKRKMAVSLIVKAAPVCAFLAAMFAGFFLNSINTNTDQGEYAVFDTPAETTEESISKPAIPADNKIDDEIAMEFAADRDALYLAGPSVCSGNGRMVIGEYFFLKKEQGLLDDGFTFPNLDDNGKENQHSDIHEQEKESEDSGEKESETEDLKEDNTTDETEINNQTDPRETVWSHYPNLGVVIAPNYLNIRTSPCLDGDIVGILFNMSGVNLLDASDDGQWYHIVSNGIEGYINAEFVATGDEAKSLAYDHAFPAVTVNAEVLNVRNEPNTESTILTQIIAGSLYEVIEETNESWLKIRISAEIEGYVSREFVNYDYALQDAVPYSVEPAVEEVYINPVRVDIVNNAMQYLGGRYVWGGTTLGVGVDCSGFMLRLFEQYGYYLPRTSYWQVGMGTPVSFENMQPGDLIFYWNNNLGRIGHVAMYIGNNLIIHAASEQRGIVIDDYRFMTPYCARNIIGE